MIPDFEINVHFDPKLEYSTSNMAFTAKFDGQKSPPNLTVKATFEVKYSSLG